MDFIINLSKPRQSLIIHEVTAQGLKELGTVSIDDNLGTTKVKMGRDHIKILPTRDLTRIKILDSNGESHRISRSKSVDFKTSTKAYNLILRDELLSESPPKVPKFMTHSFGLHFVLFAIGVTLSYFQPPIPEKINYEVIAQVIEEEIPPPVIEKVPEPEPPKPKIVQKAPEPPRPKVAQAKPVRKAHLAKFPSPTRRENAKKVVVVASPLQPSAGTTPKPAVERAAAQRADVAKALNFMSAKTGGFRSGPTFTKNKQGSMYGTGVESTPNAKSPSVLSKLGAKSTDGNITTKGSRMIASGAGVSGQAGKGLNRVQGRVSSANLYNGGNLEGAVSGQGISLSGEGNVTQSLIEKALAKHLDKLRFCYEKALLSDASLGGNILMQWTITSVGSALNIRTLRTAIPSAPMQSCVSREISKIQFPKPSGGDVIVKFPFSFTSSSI